MKKRILFVDDEPNILQGLKRSLRQMAQSGIWTLQKEEPRRSRSLNKLLTTSSSAIFECRTWTACSCWDIFATSIRKRFALLSLDTQVMRPHCAQRAPHISF